MVEGGDNLELLERSLDQLRRVIAALRTDQAAALPTPCAEWDVRTLARHVIGQDLHNFARRVRGEPVDWHTSFDELGDDWSAEFDAGAQQIRDAWHAVTPGQTVTMPGGQEIPLLSLADQQTAEFCVHAWDLVRATGQDVELDAAAAEHGLRWARRMLRPEARGPGKPFGYEVQVPGDAPAYDRLAAWLGRDPHWSAAAR